MKRYFRLLSVLYKLNFSALFAYRANFLNNAFSSVMWAIFSIVSIVLLTAKTKAIFGWSRDEALFLAGGYTVMMSIFHGLFTRNFERLSQLVHQGELDGLLVKPVDSQFLVSFNTVNFVQIARTLLGAAFMVYIGSRLQLEVGIINVLVFLFFLILGLVILYSIWLLVLTLIIWRSRLSNLVEVMFIISSIGRFPLEMYRELSYYLFLFLLPLAIMLVVPVKFVLGEANIADIFLLATLAGVLFYLSRKFWFFALKFYTSASS